MTPNNKVIKIFLILILSTVWGTVSSLEFATFNANTSSVQNSCVFDISPTFLLNSNYDPDSAEVDIATTQASYKQTISLSNDGTYAYANTTISAPLPAETKSFYFTADFYMSPKDSNTRKLISSTSSTATCINPKLAAQQDLDKQAQAQKTSNLFTPIPQGGGSTIQYGNQSFNIGGIGAALSGCLGVGSSLASLSSPDPSAVTVNDAKSNKKESCGDSLAYAASRIIIQNMSRSVINWATSGNNGNPYYPTSYQSLYENIRSNEIRSFVNELQSNDSANPYNSSFAKSLANQARNNNQSFAEKYAYTGPDSSFFTSFKNGGWNSWYSYILEPQNNPLGYSQIASKESENRQSQATQATSEELANNDGFLSQKTCDDKGYVPWANDAEQAKLTAAAAQGDKTAALRLVQSVCKNFKITTPGSLIAKQLQEVLGSPLRQAEQVDEIDEALGAVFDGIVTRLVNNGLNSLSNLSLKNNVDFSYNTSAQNPGYNKLPTGGSFWDNYNTNFDLQRDLPGIIKTQEAYVDQLNKNNEVLALVLKSIDKMDYALPGPHIGWAEGMEQRIYETAAGIKREAQLTMGGILGNITTLGIRDKILDGLEGLFIKVFTAVFSFYENTVTNKFDPELNAKMPTNSSRMITMIKSKPAYQEIYTSNAEEIQKTKDIILQLKDINNQVITLYKKACARFIKENPGASCIYSYNSQQQAPTKGKVQ